MANRIPPSLNWLIKKHARVSGAIIQTEKALSKYHKLLDDLQYLKQTLDAITLTMKLHVIHVEVKNIKPIKTHKDKMKFPRGYITKFVLDYLLSKQRNAPTPKSEIVKYIIEQHRAYDDNPLPLVQASRAVSMALSRQFIQGRVVKYHPSKTNLEGSWGLSKEFIATHSHHLLND
jgi:hypothetical protein